MAKRKAYLKGIFPTKCLNPASICGVSQMPIGIKFGFVNTASGTAIAQIVDSESGGGQLTDDDLLQIAKVKAQSPNVGDIVEPGQVVIGDDGRQYRNYLCEDVPMPSSFPQRGLLEYSQLQEADVTYHVNQDGSGDFKTILESANYVRGVHVAGGKQIEIIVADGYESLNEELPAFGPDVRIRAQTLPTHIDKADCNLIPIVDDVAIDQASRDTDYANVLAIIEARYTVKLRYTRGRAILLKNQSTSRMSGIAFIGEAGNTASAVICGDRDGTAGNGASLGLELCAFIGFLKGFTTTYGGCIKTVDNTLFIGFCGGTNVQVQYRGMFFAQGATIIHGGGISGGYNVFVKRGGLAYLSGAAGNYQTYISHSVYSNVQVSGAGVFHCSNSCIGPSTSVLVSCINGGFVSLKNTILDGGNVSSECVRNNGANLELDGATLLDAALFGLRMQNGVTSLVGTKFGDFGAVALIAEGGRTSLGSPAVGTTEFVSNGRAITVDGGIIDGAMECTASATITGGTIETWVRFNKGTLDLDSLVINDLSPTSTRDIHVTLRAYGVVRINSNSFAGMQISPANIFVRTRANGTAVPDQSNGVLEYEVGNSFELIAL